MSDERTGKSRKPAWAIARDKARRAVPEAVWLFGLHAVRDALLNPARVKRRLIVTRNAADRLGEAIPGEGLDIEMADARRFTAPLDPQSVHQGAALEVDPLDWGTPQDLCKPHRGDPAPLTVLLDRVTDPHNVGAILRTAEVFGSRAVIAPRHHAAPETGALAKSASGALERQPYVRVRNLGDTMEQLAKLGYHLVGLDGDAEHTIEHVVSECADLPLAVVLGAEGPGLRQRTRELCTTLARIDSARSFASMNVSNAAAVAMYAAARRNAKKSFL